MHLWHSGRDRTIFRMIRLFAVHAPTTYYAWSIVQLRSVPTCSRSPSSEHQRRRPLLSALALLFSDCVLFEFQLTFRSVDLVGRPGRPAGMKFQMDWKVSFRFVMDFCGIYFRIAIVFISLLSTLETILKQFHLHQFTWNRFPVRCRFQRELSGVFGWKPLM